MIPEKQVVSKHLLRVEEGGRLGFGIEVAAGS